MRVRRDATQVRRSRSALVARKNVDWSNREGSRSTIASTRSPSLSSPTGGASSEMSGGYGECGGFPSPRGYEKARLFSARLSPIPPRGNGVVQSLLGGMGSFVNARALLRAILVRLTHAEARRLVSVSPPSPQRGSEPTLPRVRAAGALAPPRRAMPDDRFPRKRSRLAARSRDPEGYDRQRSKASSSL